MSDISDIAKHRECSVEILTFDAGKKKVFAEHVNYDQVNISLTF